MNNSREYIVSTLESIETDEETTIRNLRAFSGILVVKITLRSHWISSHTFPKSICYFRILRTTLGLQITFSKLNKYL